jgi:3-hydroxypropanoate dehydrogenase
MPEPLSDAALDQLFREAHTFTRWQDRPVSDDTLRQLYDLMKWAPTSANGSPARLVFVKSPEAKERLRPALSSGNVDKTMSAPVTAIIAFDELFYQHLPRLFPQSPGMLSLFEGSPELVETTAFRNGSLQGAYLIMAARSLGLDCGPMSGFDNGKVDAEFFPPSEGADVTAQEKPLGRIRSNFLCNLGYGEPGGHYPRNARLSFEEACLIL